MPSNKVPSVVVKPGPGEAGDATVSASAIDFDASGGSTEVLTRATWADGTTNPAAKLSVAIAKIVSDLTSTSAKSGAGKITAAALSDWADSTPNPATTLADALAKIITDLTSSVGEYGAGKITVKRLPDWANGDLNLATTVSGALSKIIADLGEPLTTPGDLGAGRITIRKLSQWADETIGTNSNTATTLATALDRIIVALTSTTAKRGAGKITAAALSNWADGTTNPATTLADALAKIITDLTSVSDPKRGLGKITAPALIGSPATILAQNADASLQSVLDAVNAESARSEMRAEIQALDGLGLRQIVSDSVTTHAYNGMAAKLSTNGSVQQIMAVADSTYTMSWTAWGSALATSYSGDIFNGTDLKDITYGHAAAGGWVAIGQQGSNGFIFNKGNSSSIGAWYFAHLMSPAGQFANAITYKSTGVGTGTYVAIGTSLWWSSDGLSFTKVTGITGSCIAVAPNGNFVLASGGSLYSSPDGISNWQLRYTLSTTGGNAGSVVARQLRWSPYLGFVGLYTRSGQVGIYYSPDGVTWNETTTTSQFNQGTSVVLALLDRQIAYLDTHPNDGYSTVPYVHAALEAPAPRTGAIVLSSATSAGMRPTLAKNFGGQLAVLGVDSDNASRLYLSPRFRPNGKAT